jgi:hypothetical protein
MLTRHFSGGEEPWHFREGSVGGGCHAVAPAEFFVRVLKHMKKIGILFLLITISGSSCSNSSSAQNSAIIGSWVTDACEQLTDSKDQPVDVWAKSTYTFDSKGNIYLKSASYSDSDCLTKSNAINSDAMLVAIYSEQAPIINSQGKKANRILITFSSAPPPQATTSGYYKITNNQLCFSESFHFYAGSFRKSNSDDTEIDFNNCLTKNEP